MRPEIKRLVLASVLPLSVAACGDGTGPENPAEVTLSFVSAKSPVAPAPSGTIALMPGALATVDVTGSNGTLAIDEVQIVIDEFKLEGDDDSCEGGVDAESCVRFEALPYFLDLPLDGIPIDIASSPVPDGTYFELKLETKDLDASNDEGIASLADQVLVAFPDWPESASMRMAGSFTPGDGGDPRAFVVYFHAEVKVELSFDPPLTVIADDESTRVVVEVNPLTWFTLADGSVSDLSELDFETTGAVVDFEAKMKDGFTKVEIDD